MPVDFNELSTFDQRQRADNRATTAPTAGSALDMLATYVFCCRGSYFVVTKTISSPCPIQIPRPTIYVHSLNVPGRMQDDTHYKLLQLLEETPGITQRELAAKLGVSLGKANYCLRAVMEKGWVKMDNFRRNPHKMGYAYLLTPSGIEEKASVAALFLKRKMLEFDALKAEIERLKIELTGRTGI